MGSRKLRRKATRVNAAWYPDYLLRLADPTAAAPWAGVGN